MYYYGIIPRYVWDGYLAEKLMWLGYPSGMHGMGLKDAGINYLGVELDKTVRGQIINKGLTEDVIVYAGTDVKYLEPIMEKQKEKLKEQGLLDAIRVENAFVRCLAYIEFCGAKIDPEKWKKKLENLPVSEQINIIEKDPFMNYMCALEHKRWNNFYYMKNFVYSETKDEINHTHNCLIDDWEKFRKSPKKVLE